LFFFAGNLSNNELSGTIGDRARSVDFGNNNNNNNMKQKRQYGYSTDKLKYGRIIRPNLRSTQSINNVNNNNNIGYKPTRGPSEFIMKNKYGYGSNKIENLDGNSRWNNNNNNRGRYKFLYFFIINKIYLKIKLYPGTPNPKDDLFTRVFGGNINPPPIDRSLPVDKQYFQEKRRRDLVGR